MRKRYYELPKTVKRIKHSKYYVDVNGDVYSPVTNYKKQFTGYYIKKVQTKHKTGYMYCRIFYDDNHNGTNRVHKIVAEAFIPNPNNYPIVGHKNNIKDDNRVENLYWTTWKENIQKAVDDGLLVNDKGYDDSQSKPVIMFETATNKELGRYGSIGEAVRETGVPQTTVARQAKYHRPSRKPFYFRFQDDETAINTNEIIGRFNYITDDLIETYFNITDAENKTNISACTIRRHCTKGKPSQNWFGFYFKIVNVNRLSNGDEPSRVEETRKSNAL